MTRTRNVGRFISTTLLVWATALAASSCGTSNPGSVFDGGTSSRGELYDGSLGTDSALPTGGSNGGTCTRQTCQDQGFTCGVNGDGCGGSVGCGACTAPEFCGGGGYSQCGTTPNGGRDAGPDAASNCKPRTCADWGLTCGPTGDGCSATDVIQCGTCSAPEYCGGNPSRPGTCGGNVTQSADGGPASHCVPATCAALGFDCGFAADGCGGLLDCNRASTPCAAPHFCGGGGPDRCGGNSGLASDGGAAPPCTPTTCAALGSNCGPVGDGCGGILDCSAGGPCPAPTFCGGGGKPSVCGGNVNVAPDGGTVSLCIPKACPSGACGQTSDGCGHAVQCATTCAAPDTCGGGGTPFRCGHPCAGLCLRQVACSGGAATTLTGTVRAGASTWLAQNAPNVAVATDPVPNVLVYVPNGPVSALGHGFSAGSCPACTADVTGDPLVSTYTDFDGTFTLTNVPAGAKIPIVLQMGRWRRQFTYAVAPCKDNAVGDLNLPQNQSQGDIPQTAISTGYADALECVLLKMGIDQAEFTPSSGNGRIHVYAGAPTGGGGAGNPGATVGGAQPEAALLGAGGGYMQYDQIMLPCWGRPVGKPADELADLISYADSGGHFFATHYSYTWLAGNGEFKNAANWNPNADNPNDAHWTLNVSPAVPPSPPAPHAGTFAKWLNYVGALSNANAAGVPNPAQVSIAEPRYDVDSVQAGSTAWISGTDQARTKPTFGDALVEHFTFDTPVGGPNHCGHVIFSDFHVTNSGSSGVPFPTECAAAPLTAQERILEYMIWDLGSCVTPPPAPVCNPLSCSDQGIACGPAGDGCGNLIASCGACAAPLTCGGGGVSGQCGEPGSGACTPRSCASQNVLCGPAGDGCGGLIPSCGSCPAGQTCGGGGVAGHCGTVDAGACQPQDCATQRIACGPAGDGCGGQIASCGVCAPGQACGGGGVPGACGVPDGGACTPRTCKDLAAGCGPAGDGCGGLIPSCGTCQGTQTCGGGGTPGQCGSTECIPLTCQALGFDCGPAGDGCGNALDCGQCAGATSCGGAGLPSVCGAPRIR